MGHVAKMMTITVSKASRSVGKLLRAVREGQRIEITRHGQVIEIPERHPDDTM
jgi:hypothetical protein